MDTNKLRHVFLACLVFSSSLCNSLLALDDGIYLLKDGPPDSPIKLPGGYPGAVDRRLSTNEYCMRVESRNNWNDAFSILIEPSEYSNVKKHAYLAISLDGKLCAPLGLNSELLQFLSGKEDLTLIDEKLATRVAGLGRVTVRLRKHPGHKLAVRFACKADAQRLDKAWKVRDARKDSAVLDVLLEIKNLGEQSVFIATEHDAPARSSCLSLVPHEQWAPFCDDVRDKTQRCSFTSLEELRPNESLKVRKENLFSWFRPTIRGQYVFIGSYELPIYERLESKKPIWVEQITGAFEVTFED